MASCTDERSRTHMTTTTYAEPTLPLHSPWGGIDANDPIAPGIFFVSTPGHGGVAVCTDIALKRLSQVARDMAIRQFGWFWFEEDALWAIPAWELRDLRANFFRHRPELDPSQQALLCLRTLSSGEAEYLLARGITPMPSRYKKYQELIDGKKSLACYAPDAIVASWGDWMTKQPGRCLVMTADDSYYLIDESEYQPEAGHTHVLSRQREVEPITVAQVQEMRGALLKK